MATLSNTDLISNAYFMDNIDGMKSFEDNFFDLAIVDANYGLDAPNMQMGSNLKRKGDGYPGESVASKLKKRRLVGGGKLKDRSLNKEEIRWDKDIPTKEFFDQVFRVSKHQIIFGGNYYDIPPTRCIICWDKKQSWNNFSQWEMAWTSFDYPAKMYRISNTGGRNDETKIHPTQKPVSLYSRVLDDFAEKGMKILDPNMGSQSSRIAAYLKKMHYWGFENDEIHYKDGCERFETKCIETSPLFKENQLKLL